MKKNWKKLVCLMVAFCMLLASSGAVYAADGTADMTEAGKAEFDVSATRTKTVDSEAKIFSVSLSWPDITAVYTAATKGTWDTTRLDYVNGQAATWDMGINIISAYNKSEVPIKVGFTFVDSIDDAELIGQFVDTDSKETVNPVLPIDNGGKYYVVMPVGTAGETVGTASAQNVGFEIVQGELPERFIENKQTIGRITITIEDGSALIAG